MSVSELQLAACPFLLYAFDHFSCTADFHYSVFDVLQVFMSCNSCGKAVYAAELTVRGFKCLCIENRVAFSLYYRV